MLKPEGVDRCVLIDYVEDCENDEGLIDYVAFFFCAFSAEKMPLALLMCILWLLTLFVATGVVATDFLCPALFMISKTLGLSQNIAGVTFLAFGNTSADIFAAINGIRLGKPDLVISVIYGSGTLITTAIVGCIFVIKEFRLDKLIFVRDTLFYCAAVSLLFYIFNGPGRIRLQDAISLLGLYLLYVIVVVASRYFTKDRPLKNLHGPPKGAPGDEDGGIEFEGVHIDDDPTASMVVMRRFLFLKEDDFYQPPPPQISSLRVPTLKLDKTDSLGTIVAGRLSAASPEGDNSNTITTTASKSRRVTLFEDNLFTGLSDGNNSLSPHSAHQQQQRRSRSASLISVSKQQLVNLRRASRDIRRQSMDFLAAVSPIDLTVWRRRNWGGRTMELVKAPIRLFLLLTTPMADIEGKDEWNKPLSTLHCITGPIFVVYAFGYGSAWLGPLTVPVWVFLVAAPVSLLIVFTSSHETPPSYYNAYASYLGFLVAVTWIYTISSEVINLLRAIGIAFNLSSEIMGLTILAWGNCMLDLITNLSIARKGLPKMAIAACFGGPLMSTLVGIGLPALVVLLIDPNHNTTLGASPLLYIIYAFLVFGLLSCLIVVVALRFRVKRSLGVYLIALYLVLIVAEWLTEFQVIDLFKLL